MPGPGVAYLFLAALLLGRNAVGSGKVARVALQKLTLVLGGAASGKSALGERLARTGPAPHHYVATAEALDAEMAERIGRHRERRAADWCVAEAPRALDAAIGARLDGTLLVDCMTLWLANLEGLDALAALEPVLEAVRRRIGPTLFVSNELGLGLVPADPLSRAFREAQGRLNSRLAEAADCVLFVAAGLPLPLKGHLPP